ncbi:recombinase family protein [Amycolatopsis sp. H20-H5]|uniref:recombinase family protein n=1 Tax=Amycolatopsis sp. H20-H5 TaxID=3046309 RepID=UPI002DB80E0D|nr:recombinase family protein [Amycolatopsis sp. H20-H5]MEC3980400.1 recombinase family protein [Amycolatopsis sp. H20-H5]
MSDAKQMHTAIDIDPEGNSIPTQRIACDGKNRELGALKVGEYVEPGYSGQSIAKRPIFRELLQRIVDKRDVDYVVIYMRSRIFRNYIEAAIIKDQLDKLGVKIISAKENFGEGYMGEGMEAITDVINWMDVRRSGDDISTKMLNKAQNGGTNGRAKLGYLNTTSNIEGGKVNTITVDDMRAKYMIMAFELYSTGRYTNVPALRDKLTDLGLRMPGSNQPVSEKTLSKLLRDRYYVGYILYKGMEYKGHHTPLISEELFDRVQRVLDSHAGAGIRNRKHHHYLKGVVFCDRCKQRFMLQRAQGRRGGVYFYFFCGGREDKMCDQPYIPVAIMEKAVELHYGNAVCLPDEFRVALRKDVNEAVASSYNLTDDMRAAFGQRLAKIERKESYFLDLAAEEDWPKDRLREKVQVLRAERRDIQHQLSQTELQLETGRQVFYKALDLLNNPQAVYADGGEIVRSILNKAFFTRLHVQDVDHVSAAVTSYELREPFKSLVAAYTLYDVDLPQATPNSQQDAPQTHKSAILDEYDALDMRSSLAEALDTALSSRVSSTAVLVHLPPLEVQEPARPDLVLDPVEMEQAPPADDVQVLVAFLVIVQRHRPIDPEDPRTATGLLVRFGELQASAGKLVGVGRIFDH